jgi:hypothetical protein
VSAGECFHDVQRTLHRLDKRWLLAHRSRFNDDWIARRYRGISAVGRPDAGLSSVLFHLLKSSGHGTPSPEARRVLRFSHGGAG